ncbi:hypothetical protein ABII15_18205 [Streptomyces sp. HUAS MG91]|uniref:Uncharacterized protein n=1 Tax=Streptomyces tabacisoli TaxID=3156398 RepID=A0AAU8IUQ3_9ACTN
MVRDRADVPTERSARDAPGATDGVARLTGELLVELGRKIAEFGERAIRIVTVDEMEREQVVWFRLGWEEHARLSAGDPALPASASPAPAKLLTFPERAPGPAEHDRHDRCDGPHPSVDPGSPHRPAPPE